MTFQQIVNSQRKLVRVQQKGQVTLPTGVRKKMGIKKGDLVAVMETEEGILITPQEIIAAKLLDRMGKALKAKGLTLEELIDSGRTERGRLIPRTYGSRAQKRSR